MKLRELKSGSFLIALLLVTCSAAMAATYSYDALNRLTSVDYGNGNVITYTYDAAGNSTTQIATGTAVAGPRLGTLPSVTDLPFTASTPTIQVTNTGQGTLTWTATVTAGGSWLTITSGASGTGDGTVQLQVLANPGAARSGTVRVEAPGAIDPIQDIIFNQAYDPAISEVPTELVPDKFSLAQNTPNPFNPLTEIRFAIPEDSNVELAIYDLAGRQVRRLIDQQPHSRGWYAVDWDGRNDLGRQVATGVYLYRIKAGTFVDTKRMTLMK